VSLSPPSRSWALALLAFAQLIVAVDYNIVFVALPDIGHALGFSAHSLQWVVSAYAVGFGGFLLLGGRAADQLGARRVFVAGMSLFGAACLVGGVSSSSGLLVACRVAQGLGAALLSPATLALIGATFAEGAARNRALTIWGAAGSGGLAVGAVLGGVLTDAWGWRWVFLVLVPMSLAAAAVAPRVLPGASQRAGRIADVPGAVLATAASALLVLGLVSGPQVGWGSVRAVGALAAGAVLLAVFLLVESRTAEPLVPLRLLRRRSLVMAMLVILLFQSTLGGQYYLFTMFLQDQLGYTPLQAGLAFVPLTIVSMASSLRLAGLLLARYSYRATLTVGLLVTAAGLLVLTVALSTDASFTALLPGVIVWGVGGGITFPAMFVAAASGVRPGEEGIASGLATTAQQLGGAMGLAGLVAVATAGLGSHPAASAAVHQLRTAGFVAAAATALAAVIAVAVRPVPPSSAIAAEVARTTRG
jgi:EmrB/QacA subfamily drug resistance transporter